MYTTSTNSGWVLVELSIPDARFFSPSVTLGQTSVVQQWANVRHAAVEVLEELIRVRATAARQHLRAENVAVCAREAAVNVEPFARVTSQHFAPEISVVSGR